MKVIAICGSQRKNGRFLQRT